LLLGISIATRELWWVNQKWLKIKWGRIIYQKMVAEHETLCMIPLRNSKLWVVKKGRYLELTTIKHIVVERWARGCCVRGVRVRMVCCCACCGCVGVSVCTEFAAVRVCVGVRECAGCAGCARVCGMRRVCGGTLCEGMRCSRGSVLCGDVVCLVCGWAWCAFVRGVGVWLCAGCVNVRVYMSVRVLCVRCASVLVCLCCD
jgi:hypothetical protein